MPQLREEADADRVENYVAITDFKTEQNVNELYCATCGKLFYVDQQTRDKFSRAMEHDLDNQFICDRCRAEDEEMAYAAR